MQMSRDFGAVLKQMPKEQRELVHSLSSLQGVEKLNISDGMRHMLKPFVEEDVVTNTLSFASSYHAKLIQVCLYPIGANVIAFI